MYRIAILILSVCLPAAVGAAEKAPERIEHNWHQWRGPTASGVAPHGDPPLHWDRQKNVCWRAAVPGRGSSTPIVWEDRVFLTTAIDTERTVDSLPPPKAEPPGGYKTARPRNFYRFVVMCLDRATGRVRWQRTSIEALPHEGHHSTHGYASASATTDGRLLWVSFGSRGLFCYDLDGNLEWRRDLGDMVTRYGWGEATSPVVRGDLLAVNWDHEGDSFLVVLNAQTGETRWRVDRDEISSWSTPLVVEHEGTTQLIVSATGRVRSHELGTGRVIWQCGGQTVNVIPSPVASDRLVFCMSGFRGNALHAVPLDASGDLTDTDRIAWRHDRGTPYVPSPLLYDDRLYFTKSNSAVLSCFRASTGEAVIDQQRLPEVTSFYASPVAAAGRVYLVGRDGTTVVLEHGEKYEVLAINRLDDPIDASPAIVGREIFLRGKSHLYCIAAE